MTWRSKLGNVIPIADASSSSTKSTRDIHKRMHLLQILHFLTPQRPFPILDYHAHAAAAIKKWLLISDFLINGTAVLGGSIMLIRQWNLLLCGAEPVDHSLSIQFLQLRRQLSSVSSSNSYSMVLYHCTVLIVKTLTVLLLVRSCVLCAEQVNITREFDYWLLDDYDIICGFA